MSAFTRTARREVLARSIADMRPTTDNVHSAMLAVSEFGITYSAVAGATRTNEVRAQRWSAGADIPESVGERRAILSALVRLLGEMPTPPDRRRRQPLPDWERIINERVSAKRAASDDPKCVQCKTDRAQKGMPTCGRRRCLLRQEKSMLCAHCMRNRNNNDVVCTSRNCRNKVKA